MQYIFYPKYCICLINLNKCIDDSLTLFLDNIYNLKLYNVSLDKININFNSEIKCLLEASIINVIYKSINIFNNYINTNQCFYKYFFILNKKEFINYDLKEYFNIDVLYKFIYKNIKKNKPIYINKSIFKCNNMFSFIDSPTGEVIELLCKIKDKYK